MLIDGVDIATVGLQLLRSQLSVISQDAILLTGTIRSNLDPFGQHTDEWLNECLAMVGFGRDTPQEVSRNNLDTSRADNDSGGDKSMDSGPTLTLASQVTPGGLNISQGQRALISIARSLVRRSNIVIFDEATASVDVKTDAELQSMLHQLLADTTVITIAHRLDTIVSYVDKVVVMDGGTVAEFDTVPALLAKPDGLFKALCGAANITI